MNGIQGETMDIDTKNYIAGLDRRSIPWDRMFTAYGTAEHYNELLDILETETDPEQWKKAFSRISDFEHQSTMFPPAPFVLVFLVRILKKLLAEDADETAQKLLDQFLYYAEVCSDAERLEHAGPLNRFSDLLKDEYLLPEDCTEDDLLEAFENPEAVPDDLFYSFYYYSKTVLSQVPGILDRYGKFPEESRELRNRTSPDQVYGR